MRPFLGVRRSEVLEYLSRVGHSYREDHTNADTTFTRNRIRHELLPMLARDYNPAVVDALLRLGRTAQEVRQALAPVVRQLCELCLLEQNEQGVTVDCRRLADSARHVVREVFVEVWDRGRWPQQAMTFAKWDELAEMALEDVPNGEVRQRTFPGGLLVTRTGNRLRITPPG
jgi:tRNA(Ile)-lysidine synthase